MNLPLPPYNERLESPRPGRRWVTRGILLLAAAAGDAAWIRLIDGWRWLYLVDAFTAVTAVLTIRSGRKMIRNAAAHHQAMEKSRRFARAFNDRGQTARWN